MKNPIIHPASGMAGLTKRLARHHLLFPVVVMTAGAVTFLVVSHRRAQHPENAGASAVERSPARRPDARDRETVLRDRLAALETEEDHHLRSEKISGLILEARGQEARRLLQKLAPADNESAWRAELRSGLLRQWVTEDPRAAAEWAVTLPEGKDRNDLLAHVGIVWSNMELAAATEWAGKLPEGPAKIEVVQAVAGEAMRTQPLKALDLVVDQPQSAERDAILSRAAMEWTTQDAAGALEWAGAIEDPELREQVLSNVALVWSEQDPVAAATLVSTGLQENRLQADTVVAIAQRWAQQDPAKTAAWVEQFSESELKAAAIENVGKIWASQDPVKATEWIEAMASVSLK